MIVSMSRPMSAVSCQKLTLGHLSLDIQCFLSFYYFFSFPLLFFIQLYHSSVKLYCIIRSHYLGLQSVRGQPRDSKCFFFLLLHLLLLLVLLKALGYILLCDLTLKMDSENLISTTKCGNSDENASSQCWHLSQVLSYSAIVRNSAAVTR